MLIITCPWCGPREQTEFSCGGEAHIVRPVDTDALTDAEWGDYLFMRKNPRGRHLEQWVHTYGCRRWFNVERDTVTYKISAVYKPGEPPPAVVGPASAGRQVAGGQEPPEGGPTSPSRWPEGGPTRGSDA
jgi:heterotetrameric sarcosine oxidase delta subunit